MFFETFSIRKHLHKKERSHGHKQSVVVLHLSLQIGGPRFGSPFPKVDEKKKSSHYASYKMEQTKIGFVISRHIGIILIRGKVQLLEKVGG